MARRRTAAPGASAGCCARMAEIPGLLRLRYATSHPRDMDDDLIAAHRDVPLLMPFLHLPVQSGSDRILAAMNRKHTRRRLPPARRPAARRAARPRAVVGFHRRPSRAKPRRISRRRWRWCARSGSPRRTASNIRRGPGTPAARRAGSGAGGGEGPPLAGAAGAAARAAGALQRGLRRPRPACAVHRPRPPPWPDRRTVTISSTRSHHRDPPV